MYRLFMVLLAATVLLTVGACNKKVPRLKKTPKTKQQLLLLPPHRRRHPPPLQSSNRPQLPVMPPKLIPPKCKRLLPMQNTTRILM